MRHTMNDHPQRLPNGQWRCESGSGYGGPEWCSRPAAWVIEGLTTASPGALLCAEHYEEALRTRRSTVRYVPLDNPTPPSAPSPRDEGRAREEARRHARATVKGCTHLPADVTAPVACEDCIAEALRIVRALSPSLGTAPNSSNEEK
jgi:hypothetical protein